MKVYSFNCEGCNNSCPLEVTVDVEQEAIIKIEGNCCHRGLVSGENIARKKMVIERGYADGVYDLICPGCNINCEMKVTVKDKKVLALEGDGCPRGIKKAKQKIEGIMVL
ncbi:MAG: hypothetical protein MJ097_02120 [Dorea sp.]|nr:hypothetical protein [Dorea sp.]